MAEKRWYVRVRGKVIGPFGLAQLKALRDRGQFRRFHEVSEDRQSWRPAATLSELFPEGNAPAGGKAEEMIADANAPLTPPAEEWIYVTADGQQQGPVSRDFLEGQRRAGVLNEATLVWKPGMDQWAALGSLPAVATPIGAAPAGGQPVFSASQAADALGTVVGWRRVRTGITLVLTAAFVFCAALVLALFGGLIAFSARESSAIAVTQIVVWLIAFVADVVKTIGYGFCAAAPPQSGARGLGIASLVVAIGDAVMSPAVLLLLLAGGGMAGLQRSPFDAAATAHTTAALVAALLILRFLLAVANPLVFLFYLRTVSLALQAMHLAQSFVYLMILYGATVFLLIVLTGVGVAFTSSLQAAAAGVMCVFGSIILLLGLTMLAWGMVCLFQLRDVIANHLAKV